ncbi:hypothetical protein RF55_10654 [Lasius niger]|uniref:Uncharacterized protein n=1 Tax=Lasius niger TaxID=67767 RepID=A0A0J7KHH2_LASNI|nr:hypothetical protein RF55_10654 [Lasius niger]
MAPVPPPKKSKNPPLPYTGLHKGPETVLMCLDSGLGCFKPETVAEWQDLYLDSNGEVTVWASPWGRHYLIPKGFNHREDWVNQWQAASDECDFDGHCNFPNFVLRARRDHKDLLNRLKTRSLGALYQPFFQPKFLRLKSKGDLQYQCDRITLVCTPFVNSETKIAGIYRPFLPFTYVTPLPVPPKEIQKQKAKKPKEDLHANTGYLGSEAE